MAKARGRDIYFEKKPQSQTAAAYEMSINISAYILAYSDGPATAASSCHKYLQLKNNWEPI